MGLFRRKKQDSPEQKQSSLSGAVMSFLSGWGTRSLDRDKLVREAFDSNPIARWCIDRISGSVAGVPLQLQRDGEPLSDNHPLSRLLEYVNPEDDLRSLIYKLMISLLLTGDAFVEVVRGTGSQPIELWAYQPDSYRYIVKSGQKTSVELVINGQTRQFTIDPITGQSDILHIRVHNPSDPLSGSSPTVAAGGAIDQYNAMQAWNYNVIDNGVLLAGLLKVDGILGPNDADKYREAFGAAFGRQSQGPRVAVLGESVDYKDFGRSLEDIVFDDTLERVARHICVAYGVPAYLLGLKDGATFTNMQEAREYFYDSTVTPYVELIQSHLESWLNTMTRRTERQIDLVPQYHLVPVLAERARKRWESLDKATFMSVNEKRAIAGLPPIDGGDVVVQPPNMIPVGEAPQS